MFITKIIIECNDIDKVKVIDAMEYVIEMDVKKFKNNIIYFYTSFTSERDQYGDEYSSNLEIKFYKNNKIIHIDNIYFDRYEPEYNYKLEYNDKIYRLIS